MTLLDRFFRRATTLGSALIYASVGRWLNAVEAPWVIEHRPDFHNRQANMSDFAQLRALWTAGNRTNNGGDFTRFYAIYQNIRLTMMAHVPGDFVELGVYKGNSAAILSYFARHHKRTVYLYDTFEGFDPRDFKGEDAHRSAKHFSDTSLEKVRALVGEDSVAYIKGFFPASLAKAAPPEQIAVAHIDCDLYEPMKAGLEVFYPRMSPGGLLFLHDYGSGEWPGATRAVDEFFSDKPERPVVLPDKSGTALVRVTVG
jgi:hypothetical protein